MKDASGKMSAIPISDDQEIEVAVHVGIATGEAHCRWNRDAVWRVIRSLRILHIAGGQ